MNGGFENLTKNVILYQDCYSYQIKFNELINEILTPS